MTLISWDGEFPPIPPLQHHCYDWDELLISAYDYEIVCCTCGWVTAEQEALYIIWCNIHFVREFEGALTNYYPSIFDTQL